MNNKVLNNGNDATKMTGQINRSFYKMLDFKDTREVEFSERGLIAAPEVLELKNEKGDIIWSQKAYDFIEQDCPDTANPSLWRHTAMNHKYGLFEVCEGIYQVRGYDMSNLTVVKTNTGWVMFDPLISVECARAAFQLITDHLGEFSIKAIIISHPHVDHYAGIKGVMSQEQAADPALPFQEQLASGKIPIIVPQGFTEHAVSENVYVRNAMARRASYMYGTLLEKGEKGGLGIGIGQGQSLGTMSFILPSYEITHTGETLTVDGLTMEFQMTPGTEAPAEMNTYFPSLKALWMAENCTGTLHNLYTLRGAQVRDGNAWANYIAEAIALYGKEAQVVFQSHNWPHWGNECLNEYMLNTAAIYKFINDQSLMYLNQGYTSTEIASMIKLPDNLSKVWYTRQYYGTLVHNAKAVYQKYMGWYDANPIHLNELEPSKKAQKFVEYLGSVEKVLEKAQEDYEKGEYQWVAEITNTLVFADPSNQKARNLCADALEQLGYQSESGIWRNAYLCGALELRNGTTKDARKEISDDGDALVAMTVEMLLEYMGILVDANKAQGKNISINFHLSDLNEDYAVYLYNGVVLYFKGMQLPHADVKVSCPKMALFYIITKDDDGMEQSMQFEGDKKAVWALASYMQTFDFFFNIIEP